uniref:Uncharacterized protein n=1 Tax=Aplanochytrium stocchinoi TaxID=215587 RepID=A0A6S8B0N3_9STRA
MTLYHSNYGISMKNGLPVLQLFYEDFVRDKTVTLAVLFAFLKLFLKNEMPSVSDAVLCALRDSKSDSLNKIHRSGYDNLDGLLRNDHSYHASTKQICKHLDPYWNNHKWGDCADGLFQKERSNVMETLPVLNVAEKMC